MILLLRTYCFVELTSIWVHQFPDRVQGSSLFELGNHSLRHARYHSNRDADVNPMQDMGLQAVDCARKCRDEHEFGPPRIGWGKVASHHAEDTGLSVHIYRSLATSDTLLTVFAARVTLTPCVQTCHLISFLAHEPFATSHEWCSNSVRTRASCPYSSTRIPA